MKRASSETGIIVVGLLVFVAIAAYFISRAAPQKASYPALSTFSPRPDGAMALYELLQAEGIKAERNLEGQYHYPEGGCVAVLDDEMVDPGAIFGGGLDASALAVWMRHGGRLVLITNPLSLESTKFFDDLAAKLGPAAPAAAPHPAKPAPSPAADPAHATVAANQHGAAGTAAAPQRQARSSDIYTLDQPAPPLFSGVRQVELAEPERIDYDVGTPLLTAGSPARAVVAWTPVGQGALVWVSTPEIASNAWIDRADNHRLLLTLFKYAAQGGTVSFDEYTHGYRQQSASALGLLFQSPGGRLLLALLGLCALAFAGAAVSPARFLPPPVPPRRQTQEMVLAQASLYERAGPRRGTTRLLLDGLRQAVRQHERWNTPPDDARLARWLRDRAGEGWTVDAALLEVLEGRALVGSRQQLLRLAQACDRLRHRLG